ncbi:hypothetical protein KCU90_g116, partial [Aureobasidium melanogenum]
MRHSCCLQCSDHNNRRTLTLRRTSRTLHSLRICTQSSQRQSALFSHETVQILFHAVLSVWFCTLPSTPLQTSLNAAPQLAYTLSSSFSRTTHQRSLSDLLSHCKTILVSNNAVLQFTAFTLAQHYSGGSTFYKIALSQRVQSTHTQRSAAFRVRFVVCVLIRITITASYLNNLALDHHQTQSRLAHCYQLCLSRIHHFVHRQIHFIEVLQLKMSEVMGLRTQIMENILALQPQLLEPRWILYCEMKVNDDFNEGDSGEIINPDDQIYTESHASENGKSGHELYTLVLALNERFARTCRYVTVWRRVESRFLSHIDTLQYIEKSCRYRGIVSYATLVKRSGRACTFNLLYLLSYTPDYIELVRAVPHPLNKHVHGKHLDLPHTHSRLNVQRMNEITESMNVDFDSSNQLWTRVSVDILFIIIA